MTPSVDARRMAFREWFGLARQEAELLATLYAADGNYLSAAEMADSIGATRHHLRQVMYVLRGALDVEAIETANRPRLGGFSCQPGLGYRLTEQGMNECRAALWKIGEELRSAA